MSDTMRFLPGDSDTEKLILGAVFINATENFPLIAEILESSDFCLQAHRILFHRISEMAGRGEKIDRVTVANELVRFNELESVGGISYLVGLDDGLPAIYNLDVYCESIRRKAVLRKAIQVADLGIASMCDPGAGLDEVEQFKLSVAGIDESNNRRGGFKHISEIIQNADGGGPGAFLSPHVNTTGVPWPWSGLNRMIGFLAPGQVVCLSAGTGVGKTTILAQSILHAALLGHCVAILTLEMTAAEQAKKIIAQHGVACLSDWLRGESSGQDRAKIVAAARAIYQQPIYLDDRDGVTPLMLQTAIERMPVKPAVVGIDYAQLMDSGIRDKGANREQHVAHISRSIKKMAKRYQCAFVVLSQLNEDGKTRESRALEQDATFHVKLERKPAGVYYLSCPKARFAEFGRHLEMHLDGASGLFTECGA